MRHPHEPLLERVWQLRANLTAYDAAYVALANRLRATLLTCDARIARMPLTGVTIEVVHPGPTEAFNERPHPAREN